MNENLDQLGIFKRQMACMRTYEKQDDKILIFLTKYTGSKRLAHELFPAVKFRSLEQAHRLRDVSHALQFLFSMAQEVCEETGHTRGADRAVELASAA